MLPKKGSAEFTAEFSTLSEFLWQDVGDWNAVTTLADLMLELYQECPVSYIDIMTQAFLLRAGRVARRAHLSRQYYFPNILTV